MFETSTQWHIVPKRECGVCGERATWEHPTLGYRCDACPRPEVVRFGIYDAVQRRWWPRCFKTFEEAQAHYARCKGNGSRGEVRQYPSESAILSEVMGTSEEKSST